MVVPVYEMWYKDQCRRKVIFSKKNLAQVNRIQLPRVCFFFLWPDQHQQTFMQADFGERQPWKGESWQGDQDPQLDAQHGRDTGTSGAAGKSAPAAGTGAWGPRLFKGWCGQKCECAYIFCDKMWLIGTLLPEDTSQEGRDCSAMINFLLILALIFFPCSFMLWVSYYPCCVALGVVNNVCIVDDH